MPKNRISKLMRRAMEVVLTEQQETISKMVKWALRYKAQRGCFIGAVPYGYSRGPDGKLVIQPQRAEIVKRIFALAQKNSTTEIAAILNNENVPSPKRKRWIPSTIRRMLRNLVYLGKIIFGRTSTSRTTKNPVEKWLIVNNTHQPIVAKKAWDAVQKDRKVKSHQPDEKGKRKPK